MAERGGPVVAGRGRSLRHRSPRTGLRLLLVCPLLSLAAPGLGESALRDSCHIHPPATDSQSAARERSATIGPFASAANCNAARLTMFGDAGRCHCSASFATGWGFGRRPPPSGGPDEPPAMPLP